MKVREVLTEARWCKDTGDDPWGKGDPLAPTCLILWVGRCYPDEDEKTAAYRKIRGRLGLDRTLAIGDWQDAPERTFEEVKALVDEVDV